MLLFFILGVSCAFGAADEVIMQQVKSSGTGNTERRVTSTPNSLIGFDSSGHPVNVTAGTNITISGNQISATGGGSASFPLTDTSAIAANTATSRLTFINSGTASSGNQRYSPFIQWQGAYWNGSASLPVYYRLGVVTQFNSFGKMTLQKSTDGSAWTDAFSMYGSTGVFEVASLSATSDISTPSVDANSLILRDPSPITFFDASKGIGRFVFTPTINGANDSSLTLDMQSGFRTLTMPGNATVSGTNTGDQTISDATISTTDITTNNATSLKHGFAPKLSGVSTEFLNGVGAFATPAGGGNVSNTGTPTSGQLASWTSATVVQGITTGSGILTALGVNTGSAGAPVLFNGAGGTPSAITLTNGSGLPVSGITASTSTALGVGSIELGAAADTTIARVSAGVISVEGNTVYAAGGTDVTVADGGTGRSTGTTAYSLVATGTTATGAQQTLANGATTEILVGGGASALPAWTTATGSGAPVRGTSPDFTTSFTTSSASFTALAGATTLLTFGGTGASASTFFPSTLDATSSITGAIRTSGGISAAKAANFGTTLTVAGHVTFEGVTSTGATGTGKLVFDTAPQLSSIELGAASDTTLARSAAGVITVEGNQVFAANTKPDVLQAAQFVTLSSSATDTYVGTAGVTITAYVLNTEYVFQANTANTGAASINVNTLGAKTIVKVQGGVTTTLADNDIRVNQIVVLRYDGTNMQMVSQLGNSPAASVTGTDTYVTFFDGANNPAGDAGMTYNKTTDALTLAGPLTVGSGATTAGAAVFTQGTTQSTGTTNVTVQAPTSVTSYIITLPGAVGSTGLVQWSVSGSVATLSPVTTLPSGITLVAPVLGTPASGTLTNCTSLPISGLTASTSTALGVGSIELGAASDTTISRSAAGVAAVEGNIVSMVGPRITATTSSATPTFDVRTCDVVNITAQTVDITSMTTNMTNTGALEAQQLEFRILGTAARAITWGANFASGIATLPTTTTTTKTLYAYFEYDSVQAKWMCQATGSYP